MSSIGRYIANTWKELTHRAERKAYTADHPDIADLVKFSHRCEGRDLYYFPEYMDMTSYRYQMAMLWNKQFLQHIPSEEAKKYIDEIKSELRYDKNKGIDIAKIGAKLEIFESRLDVSVDPETLYRMASCVYFYRDERLDRYDKDLNDSKIAAWKRSGQVGFFFKKPMSELTGFRDISKPAFLAYLQRAEEVVAQHQNELQSISGQ